MGKSQTQCVVGVPWSLSPSWPWAWAPLHHTDTDVGKSYPEVRLGQHWDPAKVKIANQTWVVILSSNHSLKQLNQVLFQHWNQSMLTSKLPCQQTHKWWLTYKKLQPERALLPYILLLRLLFQSKILSLCLWVKAGRFYSETLPNLCLQSYGTDLMIIMITF